MAEELDSVPIPPYVSFGTLLNQLERMEKEGVPGRVDATYLVGMAGGTQNQFRQALRSLGLIEHETGRATPTLIQLAKEPGRRAELMGEILRQRFPKLVNLESNAVPGQLDEVLAEYGLGSDTRRKAATFYLSAATYAGIPLSPLLKAPKAPGARRGSSGGRKSSRSRHTATQRTPESGGDVPAMGTVVKLESGGTVTITVTANIFTLSPADTAFVNGLVKTMQGYSPHKRPKNSNNTDSPAGPSSQNGSDE